MFMFDALIAAVRAYNPTPPQEQAPAADAPPPVARSTRLLTLVHKLIDYGKDLLTNLQQHRPNAATRDLAWNFGTLNVALIIARITRGLRMAIAFQDRIVYSAERLDRPPTDAVTIRSPGPRPPSRPAIRPEDDDASLLSRIPTAEEIAAQIRRRPIGAVLADLCRDLGIVPTHKLWKEIDAIVRLEGRSHQRLLREFFTTARLVAFFPPDTAFPDPAPLPAFATAPCVLPATGTHPP